MYCHKTWKTGRWKRKKKLLTIYLRQLILILDYIPGIYTPDYIVNEANCVKGEDWYMIFNCDIRCSNSFLNDENRHKKKRRKLFPLKLFTQRKLI